MCLKCVTAPLKHLLPVNPVRSACYIARVSHDNTVKSTSPLSTQTHTCGEELDSSRCLPFLLLPLKKSPSLRVYHNKQY